jgi:predicted Zn-dependent peptidase
MKTKILSFLFIVLISLPLAAQVSKKQTKKVTTPVPEPKEVLDRSKRPEPAPAPIIKIGEAESFVLANGLKVFVVENHKIPRISYQLVLDYDPVLEGEDAGYIDFSGQLMRTGTTTRSKDQIDEAIDFIGARLNTSASGLYASCLTRHNEALLEIMSDIIKNASFKQDELEKIRTQTLSALEADKNEPSTISDKVGKKLLFGANHPYGESETEKSVKNITLEKCDNFYKTYFKPNIGYLAIVGDINMKDAQSLVEKYLGDWQQGEVPKNRFMTPKPPAKTVVAIVDRPNAVQSTIEVGYPVDLKPGSTDEMGVKVMNTVLGGGSFRLFNNLREKHGWTYGAYSQLRSDRIISSFSASAEVRNPVTDSAYTQILYEMNRLRTEPVGTDELNGIKNYLSGNFGRSLENPSTVANFAINTARYNLPKDYYATYLGRLDAINATDVQMMAQKYLRPDNAYLLTVGKAEEIAPKLKAFSKTGEIQYYDVDGNWYDPSKKLKPAPEGVSAETVINKYIEAIGGVKKIKKIKDATIEASAGMQGRSIEMKMYFKLPEKFLMQIGSGAMVFGKQIYNTGKGVSISPMSGETKPMEAEELEMAKEQAMLIPEIDYATLGIKAELLGVEESDGKDYYKVQITRPNGKKDTDYYDVATNLKVKTEGEMANAEYGDYRPVEGVLFPFSLTQSAGQQSLKFTVTSMTVNTKLKDDLFEIK